MGKTIKSKLLLTMLFVASVAMILSAINIYVANKQIEQARLSDESDTTLNYMEEFEKQVIQLNLAYMDTIVDKDSGSVDQEIKSQHQSFMTWYSDHYPKISQGLKKPEMKDLWLKLNTKVQSLQESGTKLFQFVAQKAEQEKFDSIDDHLDGETQAIIEEAEKLIHYVREQNHIRKVESKDLNTTSIYLQVAFFIVLISVICSSFYLVMRAINSGFSSIISQLNEGLHVLEDVTGRLSEGSESLSSIVVEQSAGVQKTESALAEVSSMIEQTGQSALEVLEKAQNSQEISKRGKDMLTDLTQLINKIKNANDDVRRQAEIGNSEIEDLSNIIKSISEKLSIMNDIVFQTKLLSFNASVEAARAGEAGKGFAVVAQEVGNLAMMSGDSAKQIFDIVNSGVVKANGIILSNKERMQASLLTSQESIKETEVNALECTEVFDEIYKGNIEMNTLINNITLATKEQSIGVRSVNEVMKEFDQSTTQSTEISHKNSNLSNQLVGQMRDFNKVIDVVRQISGDKLVA